MRDHLDHEVKAMVTGVEYLAARAAAQECDRSLSGYIRHLICSDLALKASSARAADAMAEAGQVSANGGRHV